MKMSVGRLAVESVLGIEYIADMMSDCEQNGIMCIVDDVQGEMLFFDPIENAYATNELLDGAAASPMDVMQPAEGDDFREFAIRWNDLLKKGDDDEVYKTRGCKSIHGNFTESEFKNLGVLSRSDREELGMSDEDDGDEDIPIDRPRKEFRHCWGCGRKFNIFDGGGVDKYNKDYCGDCAETFPIVKTYRSCLKESTQPIEIRWLVDNDTAGIFYGDITKYDIQIDDDTTEEEMISQIEDEIFDDIGDPYYYDREEWEFV